MATTIQGLREATIALMEGFAAGPLIDDNRYPGLKIRALRIEVFKSLAHPGESVELDKAAVDQLAAALDRWRGK